MSYMFWIWLAVIVVATVIELMTWNMTSIWFAFAALVAFILSIFKVISWEIQLIVFIVLSVALMISLRRISLRLLFKYTDGKTNTAELIGKRVRLIKGYTEDELGEVKINGVVWTAEVESGEAIAEGEQVEISTVRGNRIIVKKIVKE